MDVTVKLTLSVDPADWPDATPAAVRAAVAQLTADLLPATVQMRHVFSESSAPPALARVA